jgi:hypothetical protein
VTFFKRPSVLISLGTVIAGIAFGAAYFFWTDSVGQPVCHKVFDTVLHGWQQEAGTRQFPNVNGSSEDSLAVLTSQFGQDISDRYLYVPGLSRDDPGDLILMYVRQPTRWVWHGSTPSMFAGKAWIVVPADMKFYGPRKDLTAGECSERLSLSEFRTRLQKTLDYLKSKKPDNWEAVVKEHSDFLKSIESES